MRIVCLITVVAFLLSIALAESDVPNGAPVQYHHQRLPRPIILEPVLKLKSDSGPLDWLMNMVSRVLEPSKKQSSSPPPPPAIIGPIPLPGMGGQIYIRQLERNLPWESHHVVIKMMTRDPITGMNVPLDSSQSYHYSGDSSRKSPNFYNGYQMSSGRSNGMQSHQIASGASHHSNWQSPNRQRINQPSANHYDETFRPSTSNDHRREQQSKNHRETHDSRTFPTVNYHNDNYQRFQPMSTVNYGNHGLTTISSSSSVYQRSINHEQSSNEPIHSYDDNDKRYSDNREKFKSDDFPSGKLDSQRSTEIPYPLYAIPDDEEARKIVNTTEYNVNKLSNDYRSSPMRYKQVVRHDRMIANNRNNYVPFVSRKRVNFRGHVNSPNPRGFRQSPMTKFELNDVGGLEVIAAPNLKNEWHKENEIGAKNINDNDEVSRELILNDNDDSMSVNDEKNLARGEIIEHVNNDVSESEKTKIRTSRLSTYKIIDRSHRSQGSENISLVSMENFDRIDRNDVMKNRSIADHNESTNVGNNNETRIDSVSDDVVRKVTNLTASNRWRFQEGRQPTRIVKAIYRRKPNSEISKSNKDIVDSDEVERNS